eukprot:TRINITY_DN2714_c0_g1_i12.p1 TRINITY_DN2714_c0_g1~~TRINITY_DN2714_c0_g1_i12.p1  ORF type:complete len:1010 (-),score=157.29 TRINITY_DN2714_c0_g1_i12:251-3280(-)
MSVLPRLEPIEGEILHERVPEVVMEKLFEGRKIKGELVFTSYRIVFFPIEVVEKQILVVTDKDPSLVYSIPIGSISRIEKIGGSKAIRVWDGAMNISVDAVKRIMDRLLIIQCKDFRRYTFSFHPKSKSRSHAFGLLQSSLRITSITDVFAFTHGPQPSLSASKVTLPKGNHPKVASSIDDSSPKAFQNKDIIPSGLVSEKLQKFSQCLNSPTPLPLAPGFSGLRKPTTHYGMGAAYNELADVKSDPTTHTISENPTDVVTASTDPISRRPPPITNISHSLPESAPNSPQACSFGNILDNTISQTTHTLASNESVSSPLPPAPAVPPRKASIDKVPPPLPPKPAYLVSDTASVGSGYSSYSSLSIQSAPAALSAKDRVMPGSRLAVKPSTSGKDSTLDGNTTNSRGYSTISSLDNQSVESDRSSIASAPPSRPPPLLSQKTVGSVPPPLPPKPSHGHYKGPASSRMSLMSTSTGISIQSAPANVQTPQPPPTSSAGATVSLPSGSSGIRSPPNPPQRKASIWSALNPSMALSSATNPIQNQAEFSLEKGSNGGSSTDTKGHAGAKGVDGIFSTTPRKSGLEQNRANQNPTQVPTHNEKSSTHDPTQSLPSALEDMHLSAENTTHIYSPSISTNPGVGSQTPFQNTLLQDTKVSNTQSPQSLANRPLLPTKPQSASSPVPPPKPKGGNIAGGVKVFAVKSQAIVEQEFISSDGWDAYDVIREFRRQGALHPSTDTEGWRITDFNNVWQAVESYPAKLLVPTSFSDARLAAVAKYRVLGRFPILSWFHLSSRGFITRSSEPHGYPNHRESVDNGSFLKDLQKTLSPGGRLVSVEERGMPQQAQYSSVSGSRYVCPHLLDGISVEISGFEPLESRAESLSKLEDMMYAQTEDDEFDWMVKWEDTKWPHHQKALLACAIRISALVQQGNGVLLSCYRGYDSSSMASSLAQILLDPFYRTFQGFQVLVEKEWVSMGYPFGVLLGNSLSDLNPPPYAGASFLQFMDGIYQVCCLN